MTDMQQLRDEALALGAEATVREIGQQPQVWLEAAAAVRERRTEIDAFLQPLLAQPGLRIIFTGAGTSAFAGGVVAPTVARATARRVESVATTDLVSNPRHFLAEQTPTLVVSFARSGNSPESIAATALADQVLADVHHLIITCNKDGELAEQHASASRSLVLQMPEATNDAGFAMTSSFTSMLLSALLVFLGDDAVDVAALAGAAESILTDQWGALADHAAAGVERVVYLGSGPLAALAQEAALKLLELTAGSVVSYHDSSLGFRHGPKAVLDHATLAVVFLSNDPYTRRYDEDIVGELVGALGAARVIAIGDAAPEGVGALPVPGIRGVDDGFAAIVFIVAAQILALSFALRVGTTPDNPFPGGAVNRVVQGVRIHPLADESAEQA